MVRGKEFVKHIIGVEDGKSAILELVPKESVCVEIGVWKADYSLNILKKIKPKTLFLIDPWEYMPEYSNRLYGNNLTKGQIDMDKIFRYVEKRLRRYKSVKFHRMYSKEAAKKIRDGSVDFIYVDGNHSYEYVIEDLSTYFPKLKKGGILSGDDLFWRFSQGFPVMRAAFKFWLKNYNKLSLVSLSGGQYVFQKK